MVADRAKGNVCAWVCRVVCSLQGRAIAATRFDKWARGGVTLSLDGAGEGNDHLMKSNNRNGTRDGNETTDEWRASINNKGVRKLNLLVCLCVCVCVCVCVSTMSTEEAARYASSIML